MKLGGIGQINHAFEKWDHKGDNGYSWRYAMGLAGEEGYCV